MDFTGVDALARTALFGGIVAAAVLLAGWGHATELRPAWRRTALAVAALATIPAVVVAPVEGGMALTAAAILAIAGFSFAAALAVISLTSAPRATSAGLGLGQAGQVVVAVPPPPLALPAPGSRESRVGTFASVTAVSPHSAVELTHPLDVGGRVPEIAYLIEYSAYGRAHRLGRSTSIGRSPDAGIALENNDVSREHALVKLEGGRFVLYDLGGTNGTNLVRSGRRAKVTSPTALVDLDIIEIAAVKLAFLEVRSPEAGYTRPHTTSM